MTRIDFYILSGAADNRALLACRLADKVYLKGHGLYIHTETPEQARQLDEMLWTYSAGNFLPHGLCEDNKNACLPIHIGYGSEPHMPSGNPDHAVLINLTPAIPLFFSRFARVAEIVGLNESDKLAARERFRFYRDRGYALESHNITI